MVAPRLGDLPNLPGLLMRLREYRCAVQALIRKAFFMISVKKEDRRFLRFVWFTTEGKIEIWRLKKLPFGVNCSPFILNAVIRHHLRQEEDACTSESVRQIIRTLLESFYVDDCLTSLPSTKDADVFKKTSIALMANAGMELRKWRRNSIASKDNTADKALGICWELPCDELHLLSSSVDLPTQWTRRSLLRTVAALFDPLGLMSPVTITGRISLQCSWKEKQDWDAPLSSELCRRAEKRKEDSAQIDSFSACRWIGTHPEGVYNLHLFCDASEVAYGCCVYLVMEEETHLAVSASWRSLSRAVSASWRSLSRAVSAA